MKLRLPPGQPWWYAMVMYVGVYVVWPIIEGYRWLRCAIKHDDVDFGCTNHNGNRVDVCLRCGRIKEKTHD